MLRVI